MTADPVFLAGRIHFLLKVYSQIGFAFAVFDTGPEYPKLCHENESVNKVTVGGCITVNMRNM